MKTSPPPALATRLLERSGVSASLIGDLVEEYRSGRTERWYWKQVLHIIMRELFSSKMHAFRWLVALPLAMLAVRLEGLLYNFIMGMFAFNGFKHPIYAIASLGVFP